MSDEGDEVRDVAEPGETVIDRIEASGDAQVEFNPFSEVDDEFQPGPAVRMIGPDGLPVTVDMTTESDIPALSTESLVCMGDFSKFVLRDRWHRIIAEFSTTEVERMPNGQWVAPMPLALERVKMEADEEFNNSAGEFCQVYPIRPTCRHYVRQLGDFEHNAANKSTYRLCAARRTTEGTFMSVRDTGLWACDMREPYDAESVKRLDEFDKKKISEGASREHLPMFQGFGNGIFDTKPAKEN